MPKAKFYVVWKGRQTGIFASWEECAEQVQGFSGAEYKAFETREMAESAWRGEYTDYKGKPATHQQWLFAPVKPVVPSLCVDAACPGSPAPVEYRGVLTEGGEEVFHQGPFAGGTNNIGEFLAIVHALAWLHRRGEEMPVYTDSETALAWVRAGTCKTELKPDAGNAPLFDLIARAEKWLAENVIARRAERSLVQSETKEQAEAKPDEANPVLKWDTQAWGENPADFGRK